MKTPFQKYLVDSLYEQMTSGGAVSSGGRPIHDNPKLNQDKYKGSEPPETPPDCVSCNGVWLIRNGVRYYMEKRKPFNTLHFWYNGAWHTTQP